MNRLFYSRAGRYGDSDLLGCLFDERHSRSTAQRSRSRNVMFMPKICAACLAVSNE